MDDLFDTPPEQLTAALEGRGRAQRVWEQIRRGDDPFAAALATGRAGERLRERFDAPGVTVQQRAIAADGTRKLLLRLADAHAVETVVIPGRGRTTVCVSTQVGCARRCGFCVTATLGLERNLTAGEIVFQVVLAQREALAVELPPLRNVVLMGMGEPLDNLDATLKAIDILVHPHGMRVGPRHVTLSTVGTSPPAIRRLVKTPAQLAWSMHAVDDALRRKLVPTTRHPMAELREAFLEVIEARHAHLFVEMTLIEGVNDQPEHAEALAAFFARFQPEVRVNLLPMNPGRAPLAASSESAALRFRQILRAHDYFCAIRQPRGLDADAACGQLAAQLSAG